jgi:hypothetical protein
MIPVRGDLYFQLLSDQYVREGNQEVRIIVRDVQRATHSSLPLPPRRWSKTGLILKVSTRVNENQHLHRALSRTRNTICQILL